MRGPKTPLKAPQLVCKLGLLYKVFFVVVFKIKLNLKTFIKIVRLCRGDLNVRAECWPDCQGRVVVRFCLTAGTFIKDSVRIAVGVDLK